VRETLDAKHYSSEMGERLVNQYKIQKLLGKGAYGNVYKAIDAGTGTEYVRHGVLNCCNEPLTIETRP
jgi:serine/threonine protein kinase